MRGEAVLPRWGGSPHGGEMPQMAVVDVAGEILTATNLKCPNPRRQRKLLREGRQLARRNGGTSRKLKSRAICFVKNESDIAQSGANFGASRKNRSPATKGSTKISPVPVGGFIKECKARSAQGERLKPARRRCCRAGRGSAPAWRRFAARQSTTPSVVR